MGDYQLLEWDKMLDMESRGNGSVPDISLYSFYVVYSLCVYSSYNYM
jgi:hypothetical protein